MPKTAKKDAVECNNHEFALNPLRHDLYFKQSVTLSFCKGKADPKYRSGNKRSKAGKAGCLCCPVFNKDNNYATSTFILPQEKQNYIENQAKFKLEHQCRIKEYSEQKSQMFVPKPKTKQSYCNVCRSNYEDYLQHIKSEFHKINIRKAPVARHIKQLEVRYDIANQGRNTHSKNCFNTDTTQNGSQSDAEYEAMGLPSKKLKKDFTFTPAFCYSLRVNQMGSIPDITTFASIPQIQTVCQPKQLTNLPFSYFGSDMAYQFPNLSNNFHKNQMIPMISTMNTISCPPVSMSYGMDPNMFIGFPMLYCNNFHSFSQIPNNTMLNIPYQSQIQNIQVNHN